MEIEIKNHDFTTVYNYIMNIVNNVKPYPIKELKKDDFNLIVSELYSEQYIGMVNISQRSSTKINGGVINIYDIQVSEIETIDNKWTAIFVRIIDSEISIIANKIRLNKIKAIINK